MGRRGRLGKDLGEAPVHDLDRAKGSDHDVGRLQVAVDDPCAWAQAARLADLLEDGDEAAAVVRRIWAAGQ